MTVGGSLDDAETVPETGRTNERSGSGIPSTIVSWLDIYGYPDLWCITEGGPKYRGVDASHGHSENVATTVALADVLPLYVVELVFED